MISSASPTMGVILREPFFARSAGKNHSKSASIIAFKLFGYHAADFAHSGSEA